MCPPPNLIAHVIFSFVRGYLAPEIYVLAAPAGWFNSWTNRRIIRWLDVALDRRIRNAHVREVGQWKREIIRTKRRLGRVLKNRRTEIDRFRVVN
jgi:hypothetical protein